MLSLRHWIPRNIGSRVGRKFGKLTQTEHAEVKRVCGSHDVVSIMKVGSEKPCVVEGVENRSFKLTDSTDMPTRLRCTPE